jgi:hypothetical protein
MEPAFLVRLLRTIGIACCFTARVAVGYELDVRFVSYLVCQRRFGFEENSRDMDNWVRLVECAW